NLFAAGELDVDSRVGIVDQVADGDAAGEHDGGAIGAGLGAADQNFGAGVFAEALGAGQGFQQRDGTFGLENKRHLDGARDADGTAVIFGDGDGDEGVDQDLFFAE